MNRSGNCWGQWPAVFFLLLAGCGTQEGVGTGNSNAPQPRKTIGSKADAPPETLTADKAVAAVLRGLETNDPRVIWEFLPESYQEDVNRVVHKFAHKMDAQLWNETFESANKISEVLKTRRAFILKHPAFKQEDPAKSKKVAANWDALVGLLSTVLESNISDLDQLKTIDVGEFLAETGGRLMSQFSDLSKLAPNDPYRKELQLVLETKVELVSSNQDEAMVKLSPRNPALPTTEYEFVKVEGKWIPQTLAQG